LKMTDHYGFDSAQAVNNTFIDNCRSQAGSDGNFWVRYASPSPAADVMNASSSAANTEFDDLVDKGFDHFVLISAPSQSRLATGGATGDSYGTADARVFANAMEDIGTWVSGWHRGASCLIATYLDDENGTAITAKYWDAWQLRLNTAAYFTSYPFCASLYCNPADAYACAHASGPFFIWSNEPEPCAACNGFGSVPWNPNNCAGVQTELWQNAEQPSCAVTCGVSGPNVDFNMTNDSIFHHYMWSRINNNC
jgi:hypothetical protein